MKELFIYDKEVIRSIIKKESKFLYIKYDKRRKIAYYQTDYSKQSLQKLDLSRIGIEI